MNIDYYKEQFGGTLVPEADFKRLANKARAHIDYLTFGRIDWDSVGDNIKACICEVCEAEYRAERVENGEVVASEKVGEVSVTYASSSSKNLSKTVHGIVSKYLMHTGLMYRGAL